ncbi:MAG TPA: large conductance mechanosensitive channel protein MscL [Salinimicrobium sp.]|nr:large conductance mechanosensitive channel protein MscL [Salinimicrobium sp.]
MGILKDFKSFIMKGNIVDLAVAVIIGAAFGKIITSLVDDIIMPVIGLLMGGIDLSKQFFALDGGSYPDLEAAKEAGAATLTYGNFIQVVINFIIIAFSIFMILKAYERSQRKKEVETAAPAGPTQEELLMEIRDELKKKNT